MKFVLERRPVQFLYMNIVILYILCLLLDGTLPGNIWRAVKCERFETLCERFRLRLVYIHIHLNSRKYCDTFFVCAVTLLKSWNNMYLIVHFMVYMTQ